jgi:hypothetical protein
MSTSLSAQQDANRIQPVPAVKTHKAWYKDAAVWVLLGITVATSLAATHEINNCRAQNGVAPCDGGYGEYKAREIVRMAGTVGEDAIALGMRHAGFGFKSWAPVMFGFPAYNTSVAVRQSQIACPSGEHFLYGTKFTCVDNYDEWSSIRSHIIKK